jgi:hypothetical protein
MRTRGHLALTLLAISAALTLTPASAVPAASGLPKASYWRHCGDGLPHYNYFNLKAHNLGCRYAHRTANHHFRTGDKRFHGWRCRDRMRGEGGRTKCHRHHGGRYQEIRYLFGV